VGKLLLADCTRSSAGRGMTWQLGSCGGRQEGYRTAKARRANAYVDRPLLSSEQVRLVEDATRLVLS
jgi:hypothetical protein